MTARSFFRALERLTRPPRMGHDVDVFEVVGADDDATTCYFCGEPTEHVVDTGDGTEYVCEKCCDAAPSIFADPAEQPNEYEPSLTDDELVAVRQIIEERFKPFGEPLTESPLMETGGDMGARLEAAAATYPQYSRIPFCRARKPNGPPNVATFCDEPLGHKGSHRHGQSEFWPNEGGEPPAERPTSELLTDAAVVLESYDCPLKNLIGELRDRANTFVNIENDQ